MAVNPYFRRTIKNEQELLESLTTEAIKIYGHDMVYIPREKITEDTIFGEEVSQFKDANRIEMYMENSEGLEGDQEMSRFGLDVKESATFVVSRKRFLEVMGHHPEIRKIGRPREGDIVYFDYPYGMFEIKFVKILVMYDFMVNNLVTFISKSIFGRTSMNSLSSDFST